MSTVVTRSLSRSRQRTGWSSSRAAAAVRSRVKLSRALRNEMGRSISPKRTLLSRLTDEFYYIAQAPRVFGSSLLILLDMESRIEVLVAQSCRAGDSPRVPIEETKPP